MEVTTSSEALRWQRGAAGGSATIQATTRVNAEQASKRAPRKPTRRRNGEGVKGGVNLDHFGGAKVDQLVKG